MKVYLITEKQMEDLHQRLELAHMRANNHLGTHDPQRFENSDLYRAINYVVRSWADEVGKT
jgi:hypothetical protein